MKAHEIRREVAATGDTIWYAVQAPSLFAAVKDLLRAVGSADSSEVRPTGIELSPPVGAPRIDVLAARSVDGRWF